MDEIRSWLTGASSEYTYTTERTGTIRAFDDVTSTLAGARADVARNEALSRGADYPA
jgi:hypothetical protein